MLLSRLTPHRPSIRTGTTPTSRIRTGGMLAALGAPTQSGDSHRTQRRFAQGGAFMSYFRALRDILVTGRSRSNSQDALSRWGSDAGFYSSSPANRDKAPPVKAVSRPRGRPVPPHSKTQSAPSTGQLNLRHIHPFYSRLEIKSRSDDRTGESWMRRRVRVSLRDAVTTDI